MNEPDDHTAWVDRFGDTWVRADKHPGRYGSWWPMTDGSAWDARERGGIGSARSWAELDGYGPFAPAGPDRTARALDRVRGEVES